MSDLPDPRSEPMAGDKSERVVNPMHYDLDAIKYAIRSGQIPPEVLAELEKEKQNG
jgi:hypothetical protein